MRRQSPTFCPCRNARSTRSKDDGDRPVTGSHLVGDQVVTGNKFSSGGTGFPRCARGVETSVRTTMSFLRRPDRRVAIPTPILTECPGVLRGDWLASLLAPTCRQDR
jgi:hypothetical protein